MAKFKFILLCAILLCTITMYAQPAQYTPMTAAGYQMKRLKVDSTLHLPSFCGVPNLVGSTAKDGVLAIDTCNALLYMWTRQGGWDTVNTSGGGDFWKINGTTELTGIVNINSNNTITFAGIDEDLQKFQINSAEINFGNLSGITDTSSYKPLMISNSGVIQKSTSWFGGGTTTDTTSLSNRINSKLSIVDTTAMLSHYLRSIDTTNKFVNRLTRTAGKDSIIYFIGGTRYAIKDSVGGGSSQNGRFGNDTATVVMVKVHNDAGVTLTNGKVVAFSTSGTQSNEPAVRLANNKGDSTSANTLGFVTGTIAINDTGWVILSGKIEKLNTSAFSNGDIIYLDSVSGNWTKTKPVAPYHMVYLGVVVKANAGNGTIFVKCQNGYELDEIHDVKITSPINNQVLAYSDTQKIWKNRNIYTIVDTTSLSSRINLKLNIADTATMLTNYARTNVVNASIATKLAITDTTVFQRKSLPAYTFAANNTPATANATTQYYKDTSGTFNGSIAWTGTAPTSGTFSYRWVRIGRMVNLYIALVYGTAGATNNQLIVGLPADAPTPSKPPGLTAASNLLYPVLSQINATNQTTLTSSTMRGMLRSNSSNNGFEFLIQCGSTTAINAFITCTYFTD